MRPACLLLSLPLLAAPPSPYAGQSLPGPEPRLFAPGLVSTGLPERDIAVAPDGREIYFGILGNTVATIAVTRWDGTRWTQPEVVPFSRNPEFKDIEPTFSPDGRRLFFLSTRPPEGQPPKPGWGHQNIWMVERKAEGAWSDPVMLPREVNNGEHNYFPSMDREGTLYFTRSRPGTRTPALHRSRQSGGVFQEAERLGEAVNAGPAQFNGCISPDGSILVFCATGAGEARTDYVACFRRKDGAWSRPVNLGPALNSPRWEASSPAFSPDGKFLFFSSARLQADLDRPGVHPRLADLVKVHEGPQNGLSDIYWMAVSALEALRPNPD